MKDVVPNLLMGANAFCYRKSLPRTHRKFPEETS